MRSHTVPMSPNKSISHHPNRTTIISTNIPAQAIANHPSDESSLLTKPLIPKNPTAALTHEQQQQDDPNEKSHLPYQMTTKQNTTTHLSLAIKEAGSIINTTFPMILTGLLLYSRSMISTLFLGHLGQLPLAGGSLAIGFANITGYSILSGLSMGMEPLCGQAFGAKRYKLLGLVLQRTVLLLLLTSIPISFLWLNMRRIILLSGQQDDMATQAQTFILYSLPDLIAQCFLHPTRIYLRTQSVTLPLTFCATISLLLHVPINYLLVSKLELGIKGVALGSVWANFNLVALLIVYVILSGVSSTTWCAVSSESFREWSTILRLAIPSCVSVCLEWWWYEIMILLCGLLHNPKSTVASMGILIQTTALIYIFPSSLSCSVSTRVGNELGANQPTRAKLASVVGLSFSLLLGISALGFNITVRRDWAKMFTDDADIIGLTSAVLPIIGLCELGNCLQTTLCGVLRGSARPKLGAIINWLCFYCVGMPVAVWLGFYKEFGFKGLWLGLLSAQGACAVAMLISLARTDWEREVKRARELTGSAVAPVETEEVVGVDC